MNEQPKTPAVFDAMRRAVDVLRERLPMTFAASENAVNPAGVQEALAKETAFMSRDTRERLMTSCVAAALLLDGLLDLMGEQNRLLSIAASKPGAVCLSCRGTKREIATGNACQVCAQ